MEKNQDLTEKINAIRRTSIDKIGVHLKGNYTDEIKLQLVKAEVQNNEIEQRRLLRV